MISSKTKVAKFEPGTTIKRKIDDIKADHMKSIYWLKMQIFCIDSNITSSSSEYLSENSNIWTSYKTLKEKVQIIKNTTINPSTVPKSNVKLKRFFVDITYLPLGSNQQETFLTVGLALASTLHRDLTITYFFASTSYMESLTVKKFAQKDLHRKTKMYHMICSGSARNNIFPSKEYV